jgi:hypothetical protein
MVNLEIRLGLYSDLELPDYVWVNDEEEREREGYYWVDVSVNDDDFESFEIFLNANKEDVISYKVY